MRNVDEKRLAEDGCYIVILLGRYMYCSVEKSKDNDDVKLAAEPVRMLYVFFVMQSAFHKVNR